MKPTRLCSEETKGKGLCSRLDRRRMLGTAGCGERSRETASAI